MNNVFVSPKEIWTLPDYSDKSLRAVHYLCKRIKEHFGKSKHQKLTFKEVSEYLGIEEGELRRRIR